MFLKTGAGRRGWSLAARLSAWYAASTFLLLAIATGLLAWALMRGFDDGDEQYLQEKVNVLTTLLRDRSKNAGVIEWEVNEESHTRPTARVFSRVIAPEGKVLSESQGMAVELPVGALPPARLDAKGVEVATAGTTYRAVSALLPGGYTVQVAVDLHYEKELLAQYRRQIWLVLGLGLVASVLIGYRIGKSGIRPVTDMAGTMRHIGSSNLGERMESGGLPTELSALAATFNQMLDRLEDAFGRLAQFSSDIAHELRTPVNNLRLDVEVALSKARSPEEYHEVLESLLEEFERLTRLIDSLLFLARSENPQTQIRREELAVERELAAIREFYEAPASEAGVRLELEAAPDLRASLDRTLFQRAVGNLIENSLAHTPDGGVVRMAAERNGGELQISVSDTGEGIPAEHLPNVFNRFHRVDAARSRHAGGLGLGLAIVKSVAALHGGRASVESRAGMGTTVRLAFPA